MVDSNSFVNSLSVINIKKGAPGSSGSEAILFFVYILTVETATPTTTDHEWSP